MKDYSYILFLLIFSASKLDYYLPCGEIKVNISNIVYPSPENKIRDIIIEKTMILLQKNYMRSIVGEKIILNFLEFVIDIKENGIFDIIIRVNIEWPTIKKQVYINQVYIENLDIQTDDVQNRVAEIILNNIALKIKSISNTQTIENIKKSLIDEKPYNTAQLTILNTSQENNNIGQCYTSEAENHLMPEQGTQNNTFQVPIRNYLSQDTINYPPESVNNFIISGWETLASYPNNQ